MSKLAHYGLSLTIALLPFVAQAQPRPPMRLPLNKIDMQLSAEKWAETSSARVIISVDAVLSQSGLAQTHNTITDTLQRIAKGDWHITSFNRSKDQSGLERLYVQAEARLPESMLSGLRGAAERMTKPGTKFRISSIQFTPSLADIEATKATVREVVYQQAKKELAKIDAKFPDQHYFIHSINFNPMVRPVFRKQVQTRFMAAESADAAVPAVTVSDKVTMTANVTIAAKVPGKGAAGKVATSHHSTKHYKHIAKKDNAKHFAF